MNIAFKIVKESSFALALCGIMSSVGGITLESISHKVYALLPFIILLPAMNDLVGDFGCIIASRFIEWLETKEIKKEKWWKSHLIGVFFTNLLTVALLSIFYLVVLALLLGYVKGYSLSADFVIKTLLACLFSGMIVIAVIFWLAVTLGFYYHKRKIDPSNTLVPLMTSFADMGSIILLTIMIVVLF